MRDAQTGIAIRFIRQFDLTHVDGVPTDAFVIASHDDREIPFGDKFRDAMAYLQARKAEAVKD